MKLLSFCRMKSERHRVMDDQNADLFNRSNGEQAFCFRHRQGLELLQHVHCSFLAVPCDNGMQGGY